MQRRIIRSIFYLRKFDSTTAKFNEHKLLKLNNIFVYFSALLIYKVNNQNYCPNIFSIIDHAYPTRQALVNMVIPRTNTLSLLEKSVIFNSPKIWNSLPMSIKNCLTVNNFKNKLKHNLLQNQN